MECVQSYLLDSACVYVGVGICTLTRRIELCLRLAGDVTRERESWVRAGPCVWCVNLCIKKKVKSVYLVRKTGCFWVRGCSQDMLVPSEDVPGGAAVVKNDTSVRCL